MARHAAYSSYKVALHSCSHSRSLCKMCSAESGKTVLLTMPNLAGCQPTNRHKLFRGSLRHTCRLTQPTNNSACTTGCTVPDAVHSATTSAGYGAPLCLSGSIRQDVVLGARPRGPNLGLSVWNMIEDPVHSPSQRGRQDVRRRRTATMCKLNMVLIARPDMRPNMLPLSQHTQDAKLVRSLGEAGASVPAGQTPSRRI